MGEVIAMASTHDWKWHRDRIVAAWGKHIESIIAVGKYLIEAKGELKHGSFMAMVRTELPFGQTPAERLRKIAAHPILSKSAFWPTLPSSWPTLYELTKLPHDVLLAKLKDGTINPKTTRKELMPMTQKPKKDKPPKKSAKAPKPTPKGDDLIEEYHKQIKTVATTWSKERRIKEVDRLVRELDLSTREWVTYFELKTNRKRGK